MSNELWNLHCTRSNDEESDFDSVTEWASSYILSLERRLVECQAREKVRINALQISELYVPAGHEHAQVAKALALPSDSTALDSAIKASIEDERQNPWKMALMDGLVITHTLCKEHETDPRKAVNDLISWHVTVALDPQVSSAADELVRQAKREALLEAANHIDGWWLDKSIRDDLHRMAKEMK